MNTESFRYYLKENNLAERTIQENIKDIIRFNEWATAENFTSIVQMNYNELLKYVQYLKKQALTVQTINIRVNSLRKYYNHLKDEGIIEKNPAKHLRIKGELQRITENPLSYTQLEELYTQYSEYSKEKEYHLRNLAMLGLMIGQGVHSGEIKAMEVKHIQLNNGTAYIPSTRRSNSRTLKLEARQIITLHSYLNTLPANQEKLFEGSVNNWMFRLANELKGINPMIKNAQHVRASVVLHWIKMYDKRQVQYMAGHRYINSTKHYEVQEMDSLTDMLTKYHPFG
ncbi:MAG: site-specific integrase [Bacteroidia bacterium]